MSKHTLALSTELTAEERADLYSEVEAYIDMRTAEITADRRLVPHVVAHEREAVPDETVESDDEPEAGDPRPKGSRVTGYRDTITACPDCGVGLIAARSGTYLICQRLGRVKLTVSPQPHQVVACGLTSVPRVG